MKKKFNEWRNQLTRRQKDVLYIVNGIICMLLGVGLMIGLMKTAKIVSKMPVIIKTTIKILEGMGLVVLFLVSLCLIVYGICRLTYDIKEDFTENRLLKLYNEKL